MLVVQFEGVLPETAQFVTYEPIDLDGQVGIVVDIPSEVYELVRLVVGSDLFPYCETQSKRKQVEPTQPRV